MGGVIFWRAEFFVGGGVQMMQRTGFGSGVSCGAYIGAVEGLVLFLWVSGGYKKEEDKESCFVCCLTMKWQ
eukprot:14968995-Ditylum_brightwellii.AAC.1